MQKITPFLWFNGNAEEAMEFYTSIFKNSKIVSVRRFISDMPARKEKGPKGTVVTGTFRIGAQEFMVLNGGPQFKFTEAISFFVNCETQGEVNYLWDELSVGGSKSRCGWITDKFGLTWQIIPSILGKLLHDKDPDKSARVMKAMLQMSRIEIADLKKAYEGNGQKTQKHRRVSRPRKS